jgi:hypothetical protein
MLNNPAIWGVLVKAHVQEEEEEGEEEQQHEQEMLLACQLDG